MQLRFFQLFFLAALSATILTGCERQLLSPIDSIDPPQINTQFTQNALLELADTAAERKFVDLANAASGVAAALAIDDGGTSVEPTFSKIAKLAQEVTVLEQAFVKAGCGIELQKFAEASVNAVESYTIRDAADMEQALQNLAQGAIAAETALGQLPTQNDYVPFAFGYGRTFDVHGYGDWHYGWDLVPYKLGECLVTYDQRIRPISETRAAMIAFLDHKGFKATTEGVRDLTEVVYIGADVDPHLFRDELSTIPGVALVSIETYHYITMAPPPRPFNVEIIDHVRTRYNEAWCQGNFDAIDSILTGEVGLDFFDYAFVRKLADIYAEEIPETAELIQTNGFSLRSIAIEFLNIYQKHSMPDPQSPTSEETFHNLQRKLDEIDRLIEHFRQSVRDGNVSIEHAAVPNYYYWIWTK